MCGYSLQSKEYALHDMHRAGGDDRAEANVTGDFAWSKP